MAESEFTSPDAVGDLVARVEGTAYHRQALRALGSELPTDDAVLGAAMKELARQRNGEGFTRLYVAATYAGRRVAAAIMETGAALLADASLLVRTVLRLDGNVAEPLIGAVRSGRMGTERDAISLVAAYMDYERREEHPPAELRRLTRKAARHAVRSRLPLATSILLSAVPLSGDPVLSRILGVSLDDDPGRNDILKWMRHETNRAGWDVSIPASAVVETALSEVGTVKRAVPKVGRNDPCSCGSGRKYKRCCFGKETTGDQYEVEGVTIAEAEARPELLLTEERIDKLRSYELYRVKPERLVPVLVARLAQRLAVFREIPRAMEVLRSRSPEDFPEDFLEEIAYEFYAARDPEALRWILDWADGRILPDLDTEVFLASPEERLRILLEKVQEAFAAEKDDDRSAMIAFREVATVAFLTDPGLGILLGRGVLPVCGWLFREVLLEDIDDARDELGLDHDEPAHEIADAAIRHSRDESRHAEELDRIRDENTKRIEKRDTEIGNFRRQIDSLQEDIEAREKSDGAAPRGAEPATGQAEPAPAPESTETRELRERLRRLKQNLKVEHDDRNRAMRELRAAQNKLRRAANAEARETEGPESRAARDAAPDLVADAAVEWERQPLRIPDYAPAFVDALRKHPRPTAAAALGLAGRLAGGDPSAWKPVRALKQRPGTLRARVGGDYRLLFSVGPDDSLLIIDLILRRDLERWLAG
jgi:hypothetical protein